MAEAVKTEVVRVYLEVDLEVPQGKRGTKVTELLDVIEGLKGVCTRPEEVTEIYNAMSKEKGKAEEHETLLGDIGANLFRLEDRNNINCPIRDIREEIEKALGTSFTNIPRQVGDGPQQAVAFTPGGPIPDIKVWLERGADAEAIGHLLRRVRGVESATATRP